MQVTKNCCRFSLRNPCGQPKSASRRPAEIGGELRKNYMKHIKFLALIALAAAALSSLNGCEAKASTSSAGASASTTTTSTQVMALLQRLPA